MTAAVEARCLWVSPSDVGSQSPETSAERFARTLVGLAQVRVVGLKVWTLSLDDAYDLATEVAAVERAAADQGWSRYHLFGFSAGATVALAAARANPRAVATVAVFEPATIGDDAWGSDETRWRSDLAGVRALPREQRQPAFRRLLMAPGQSLPAQLAAPPMWDEHTDKLEDMLAAVGFDSADLAGVTQPVLSMAGALSNPRFAAVADRVVTVLPRARSVLIEGCSHLAPPHRVAQDRLTEELRSLWTPG